jgi:hypothetical protein
MASLFKPIRNELMLMGRPRKTARVSISHQRRELFILARRKARRKGQSFSAYIVRLIESSLGRDGKKTNGASVGDGPNASIASKRGFFGRESA